MPSAPREVVDLVERFAHNIEHYRRSGYNETQARVEYIDPLFIALGWDMHNQRGASPLDQEVIHEATLRGGGATGGGAVLAPDYGFRVGSEFKFYVEAKKPSVDIANRMPPAFQLRSYAWTADLPLSILTDFEEFAVYDCRYPPRGDGPSRCGPPAVPDLRGLRRALGGDRLHLFSPGSAARRL